MSPPQSERGKPCDNCGDLGFTDFIAVCSQCNEAREHIYCMKEFHDEVPANWVCEKCESLDEPISPRPKVKGCKSIPNNSDTPVTRSFPESSVKQSVPNYSPTGKCFPSKSSKVKFIPAEEAKLLSSGAMVKASRSRSDWSSPRPKKATMSSVLRRSAFLKDKLQKGISSTNSGISQPTTPHVMGLENVTLHPLPAKPPNPQHTEASSGIECKSNTSAELAELKSSSQVDLGQSVSMRLIKGKQEEDEACRLRHAVAPAHVSPRKLSSQVDLGPTISKPVKNEKRDNDEACRPCPVVAAARILPRKSSQVDPGPAISKPLIDGKQEEDEACRLHPVVAPTHVPPRKLSSLLEDKLPNHPLPDALWGGNFEIVNSLHDHCLHFCYGIQAHRPIIVSSKACEVSKWMPNVLLLKLQPRCDIWPRIFLKDSPDANDIALYFFSDNCDRSRLNYVHLVELMEHHDWAMTGYIDDAVHVELVIFTSKQLPVESQRLDKQIYLWGVFICKKDATSTSHSTVPSSSPHGCPMQGLEDGARGQECVTQSQIQISSAGGEDCDMEIDMIGGKVVRRVDVLLPSLDSENVMASGTHLNGHKASSDRNGLVAGSSMTKQEFPIPSSMSIEHDALSLLSAPDFSKPVRSEAAEKNIEKLTVPFGIKTSQHVRFTGAPSCFSVPSNIEGGNCQSDSLIHMDGSSAVRSSEVQRSTNVIIPRCLPEITKNTAFSNEHQSSQAASGKQEFPPWSTRPRSRRVTRGIGSRGFLGSPHLKNHSLQNPRCFVESYNLPLRTNPSNIKKDHQLPKDSDYREGTPVGGSTKLQSSTECVFPAVPPGFTKPSNLIDEYQLSRGAIREDNHAMMKIEVQGEPSRQVYGSPRTLDAKDDLHMPWALASGDEKHTVSSCDIQSLSQPTFPGVAPGFTNLINPNDESQPSRATIKIRKNIMGSSETHNSALNGDNEMVDAASSGKLLRSWFPTLPRVPPGFTNLTIQSVESQSSRAATKSSKPVMGSFEMQNSASKSASDDLIDKQKPQTAPPAITGCSNLNLYPEVKVEMFGIHSPCEATQKQLLPDKELLRLSLSRPHSMKDGNNWIAESSKELLKQGAAWRNCS